MPRAEDATVKLADFGIAKALSDESSITQVGSVLGTAAYLAPEQAAGEEIGPPADLYALGVVTYQLLSGRLPYEAQSLTELALKQQRETPPLLDDVNSNVPPALAAAVDKALELDPRRRHATADAMREALEQGAAGVGPAPDRTAATRMVTGRTSVAAPGTEEYAAAPAPARAPRVPRPAPAGRAPARRAAPVTPPRRRRRRGRRILGTLLLLALVGGGTAAAIVATSASDRAVRLRDVVYDQADRVITELETLIRDNTQ